MKNSSGEAKAKPATWRAGATMYWRGLQGMLEWKSLPFTDIEKFYECVSHQVLAVEGHETDFPEDLLMALCAMYSGPRVATFGHCVSEVVHAGGTILAGCSRNYHPGQGPGLQAPKGLSGKYAGLHLKNIIDDVSLQVVGTRKTVTSTLGGAAIAFAKGLKDLRLPLSPPKTKFVASTKELGDSLKLVWQAYDFSEAVVCRNLGTDAVAEGRHRQE